MSDGSTVSFPLSISCLATHAAERLCRSGRERNYRREPGNGGWRRSANRVVKGPSPKGTATARLRRFRTFPPSPLSGEVRPATDLRRDHGVTTGGGTSHITIFIRASNTG
jgi:hypothetical protein